jgi:hypothetical protein
MGIIAVGVAMNLLRAYLKAPRDNFSLFDRRYAARAMKTFTIANHRIVIPAKAGSHCWRFECELNDVFVCDQ